jgi:hypothetical protein
MFAILSSCCGVVIRVCNIWNVVSLNYFHALLHLSCKIRSVQNNKHLFCLREKSSLSSSYFWNLHSNSMNLEILLRPWWQRLFLCWGKNVSLPCVRIGQVGARTSSSSHLFMCVEEALQFIPTYQRRVVVAPFRFMNFQQWILEISQFSKN